MVKLYYMPGSCALAPHIALTESGLEHTAAKVERGATGLDPEFLKINPKGYVPALVLPDGSVLTEANVILQYIADQAPSSGLIPAAGTLDRYRVHCYRDPQGLWTTLGSISPCRSQGQVHNEALYSSGDC
eukprot:TRINITY_DN5736_c0_g1_i1.p2 TRINITY_DN5736_c0_g1~~TRINITY_DN5736_c0_g1_i1.p2  ORF type:complete len:130 (-),score=11.38 TRINITY_DN5736_c0_g1_i1:228-617(-)